MKNKLTHFAIYIDDIERASKFYSSVFDWGLSPHGPTDFLQIKANKNQNAEPIGALQSRNYAPVSEKPNSFECTIGVENMDDITEKVMENGGQILLPKTVIPSVGWISKFLDTEGNLFRAMHYDNNAK